MVSSLFPRPTQAKSHSLAIHCGLALFICMPSIRVPALRSGFYAGRATSNEAAQDNQQSRRLEPGKPIERELAAGASHSYQLALDAGQCVKLVVEQRGIDVVGQLLGPDGKQIADFDSESGPQGQVSMTLVVEEAGGYRLTVRPTQKEANSGSYEIRIEELRAATDDDRALQEARRLYKKYYELHRAGKFDDALTLVERALEIRERILGAEHRDVAVALRGLATLYYDKGEYAKAEPLYQRALIIQEKALGPKHREVANTLYRLGVLHFSRSEYEKSESLHNRALAIREEVLGPEHPLVAFPLNSLASICAVKGDYVKAERLFNRALKIREKALGPEHPLVSDPLANLAIIYYYRGDYEKAEPLFNRALTIDEKSLGSEHPGVADSLNNFGIFYRNKGEDAKAEPLLQRALKIREKMLGPEHPEVANTLRNLADLYDDRGDYAKAEQLYKRSLDISERALGPEHPSVASTLNNLAEMYDDMGSYAKAEPLYHRALALFEKALGPEHPYLAESYNNLARHYTAKGDIAQAVTVQSRANAVSERNLAHTLAAGSERQKLAYLALFSEETDFTLSLHSQIAPDKSEALNLAFTTLLRRKGRGLDAMTDTIATLRRHSSPQDRAVFDQLTQARSNLAALILKESGADSPENYKNLFKPLEEKVEQLESELSVRSDRFRAQTQPVTLAAVQAALPADGALVEFAIYTPREPQTEKRKPPRYLAYALEATGGPRWIDLGEAVVVDRAVDAWRKALRNPNRTDVKKLARAVDDRVMRPVRQLLGKTRRLLIAPDGSLNLIPFAALVDEQNRYLIERYTISYLTCGRDLLRLKISQPSENAPMIMANPAFGRAEAVVAQATRSAVALQSRNPGRTQSDSTKIYFQPLPSTGREALAIKSLLPEASVLVREQATESALKQVKAPRILHVATHGFFLDDQEAPPAEARGGVFGGGALRSSDLRFIKWAAKIENPLLRSGLALAGANQGKSGEDDGLLTAMEVAGLDLWGTKLVVLSACDTGLGEVKNGEGVQGLRRALVLAGSESQVMSLWPVLDNTTMDLMIPYYKALRQGKGRSDGLRQAQLQMLRSKEQRRPFYWAAFIQSGEWANLDGRR
jgi:CHAT domain-containing protein/Tfp pilus assembly protein PilF